MTPQDYARLLDELTDEHQARLDRALVRLESTVESGLLELPTRDGRLFDLAAAVNQRVVIGQAMDAEFLSTVDELIREYDQIGINFRQLLDDVGQFTGTEANPQVLAQLQRMSYLGFEDIAYRFRDTIAEELYQSTIAGREASESIRNIRQRINGVYIRSDQDEIERLVEIAKGDDEESAERAVEKLHTVYAADRAGNSLRRYAYQQVQDSIMQHSAAVAINTAREVGAKSFQYFGTVVDDTRDWCIGHLNKTYTRDEIETLWEQNQWAGKAPGDPFIVRGGHNCRHHWLPVFDEDIDVSDLLDDED